MKKVVFVVRKANEAYFTINSNLVLNMQLINESNVSRTTHPLLKIMMMTMYCLCYMKCLLGKWDILWYLRANRLETFISLHKKCLVSFLFLFYLARPDHSDSLPNNDSWLGDVKTNIYSLLLICVQSVWCWILKVCLAAPVPFLCESWSLYEM